MACGRASQAYKRFTLPTAQKQFMMGLRQAAIALSCLQEATRDLLKQTLPESFSKRTASIQRTIRLASVALAS
eukprot:947832-Amphidinium_carterae.1